MKKTKIKVLRGDKWRRFSVKRGEIICAKEWEVESRDNPVTSWCINSRIWREMEDNRVGNKKLLIVRDNKKCKKICKWVWYMSKNKELDKGISREVDSEQGSRKTMNTFNS